MRTVFSDISKDLDLVWHKGPVYKFKAAGVFRIRPQMVLKLPLRTPSACSASKIVSEYDQETPQSQTADNPVAPRGRADQPSRDTRKTN